MSERRSPAGECSRLLGMFETDSETYLQAMREFLVRLSSGHTVSDRDFNHAYRCAHSLKSEAGFLGYSDIVARSHEVEDSLDLIRESQRQNGGAPGEAESQRLAGALEALEASIDQWRDAGRTTDDSDRYPVPDGAEREAGVRRTLSAESRLFQLSEMQQRVVREAKSSGDQLYEARVTLSGDAVLTYARLFLILSNLETVVSVVKTDPHPDELPHRDVRGFTALLTAGVSEQQVFSALDVDQVAGIELTLLNFDDVLDMSANSDSSRPGMLLGRAGVVLTLTPRNYELLALYSHELMTQLDSALERISPDSETAQRIHRELRASRVLAGRVNSTLARTSLVPLSRIFSSLHRFVEEHAEKRDKRVRLAVEGEREQLFLPVAEVLSDALLHLLRNSIDHGIEPPDERLRAGKPVPAVVKVAVTRNAEELCVRVSDDGRGVNASEIRRKAGYEKADRREGKTGGDGHGERPSLLKLMMAPGVTTRSDADHSSGRGVGLDAVRHSVENLLGGSIELETGHRNGVTIAIKVPDTARLLTVVVFEAGSRYVAVPAAQVLDTFPIERDAIRQDIGGESFYRTDSGVARIFAVSGEVTDVGKEDGYGILLSVDGRKAVVLVDRVVSEEVVVRRSDQPNAVYSRTCGDLVSLFIPVSL